MPYEIVFENPPAGYAEQAARRHETVAVRMTDFLSSEEGEELVQKLEGFPQEVLSRLPHAAPFSPSMVDSLLVVIRKDLTATVYLNEVRPVGLIRIRRKCKKGELIPLDQVLDIGPIRFEGVEIPRDAGVVYVFSVGWRKGYFYDFMPLRPDARQPRKYDLEEHLGNMYAYLLFQDRLKIPPSAWNEMLSQKWFPFAHLSHSVLGQMVSYAREEWSIDDLLPTIRADVNELLERDPLHEKAVPMFVDNASFLSKATEHYLSGDHLSCAHILYPRIEGLLRSFSRSGGNTEQGGTRLLSQIAVEHHQSERIANSLLFPARFRDYLDSVFFAPFTPGSNPEVSRHSLAHGEAGADRFSEKESTIALLIVYQLGLFFSTGEEA